MCFFLDNFILSDASSDAVENDKKSQSCKCVSFVFICAGLIACFILIMVNYSLTPDTLKSVSNIEVVSNTDIQLFNPKPEKSQGTLLRTARDCLKLIKGAFDGDK